MNSELVKHLTSKDLLWDTQYSFHFSKSTADLAKIIGENVYQASDKKDKFGTIALDMKKSFDKVWHTDLLWQIFELIQFIAKGKWSWMSILLGVSFFFINTGVTQGFIFGPTMFLVFINDFPDVISF